MMRLLQLEKQIARLERRAATLNQISRKYWNARRIIFVCGVVLALAFCNFAASRAAWIVAAILLVLFSIVSFFHAKVRNSLTRNSVLKEIKQVQIARIVLDWDHLPPQDSSEQPIPYHPFETDLDITGTRSLHRLLDCAVTKEGSDRLKSWLLSLRPDFQSIKQRQALVEELKGHSLFRDKLQLLSAVARVETGPRRRGSPNLWNSSILVDWIQHGERKPSLLPTVLFLFALSALNITCIVLVSFDLIPPLWPITLLIYFGSMMLMQSRIATAWDELYELEKTLNHFKVVFRYLESRSYKNTPGLAAICAPFADESKRPSF
jgi:hypothetical protein